MIVYMVRPKESLDMIARRFDSTPEDIIKANGLTKPYTLVPGMNLVIPTDIKFNLGSKQDLIVLGYYYPYLDPKRETLKELAKSLTYLGYFDFPVTADGDIIGTLDEGVLKIAKANDVGVIPALTNLKDDQFSPQLANELISNDDAVDNLITNIVLMIDKYDLAGINIDFENLFPQDRQLFTDFITKIYNTLAPMGKKLIINVGPKFSDSPDKPWVGFYDFNALGDVIDYAAIMTYEWGYQAGPASATAPIEAVNRSLRYAMDNNIPPEKILMGFTMYGYDWTLPFEKGNMAETITLPKVWNKARKYEVPIQFSGKAKQPFMTYMDDDNVFHEAWFEDALSHSIKFDLVERYNLAGIFYWVINYPFDASWYILNKRFNIVKCPK